MNYKHYLKIVMAMLMLQLFSPAAVAQTITITDSVSASDMAMMLAGPGVTVSNATMNNCPGSAYGKFLETGLWQEMGMDSGIVLTTGNADNISNPVNNIADNNNGNTQSDPDLNNLSGAAINTNACVLEFDFVPNTSHISFNYVFASDEYPRYNCTNFNDVFGFFISGPGITNQNVALVPGTNIPVMINSINNGTIDPTSNGNPDINNCYAMGPGAPFTQYYIDVLNGWFLGLDFIYNGRTIILSAEADVTPCETYHLKIGIQDVGDGAFDSGVFLKAGSLKSVGIDIMTQSGGPENDFSALAGNYCVRECLPATVTFYRAAGTDINEPITVNYDVEGDAVNGVDYTPIPSSMLIPAGEDSVVLSINGLTNSSGPGPDTVLLYIHEVNSCSSTPDIIDSVAVIIYDRVPLNIINEDIVSCDEVSTDVNATYDIILTNFSWSPATGVSNPDQPNTTITASATSSYVLTGTDDSGCESSDTLNITILPAINIDKDTAVCGQAYPFMFAGTMINGPGNYTINQQAASGCDSNINLTVTTGNVITAGSGIAICQEETPYVFGSQQLTASGIYNETFTTASGCDSIAQLTLTVNPTLTSAVNISICANELPYNWNGQAVAAGGAAAASFTTSSLITGCDSTAILNLAVLPVATATEEITVCNADLPYQWNGNTVTSGGTGVATFTTDAANGCDSTVMLNLTILPTIQATEAITICENELPYQWNGNNVNSGGNNAATFITSAANGCDSMVTLNLAILPTIQATEAITICENELPYSWNGIAVNNGGSTAATFTGIAINGCDSVTTLILTLLPGLQTTEAVTICYTQLPYEWNGQTITNGGDSAATFVTTAATGCDSTVILNLSVSDTPQILTMDTAACSPVIFEGTTYTQSTILYDTFLNAGGCDSIYRTVNIIAYPNNPVPLLIDTSACKELIFEGINYTSDTTLTDTFHTMYGCDSIYRTTTIHILNAGYDTIPVKICEGEKYHFFGEDYGVTGQYVYTTIGSNGCDSVITLDLTVHPLPMVAVATMHREEPLCVGDTIRIYGTGALRYVWENGYGDLLGTADSLTALLPEAINRLIVTGLDTNGCVDTAIAEVAANHCCELLMPTAFSPNGDGINDKLGPVTYGNPQNYQFRIFNRWGQCVFVSHNVSNQWDGTVNGKPADIGAYFYLITGKCSSGEVLQQRGELVLVR